MNDYFPGFLHVSVIDRLWWRTTEAASIGVYVRNSLCLRLISEFTWDFLLYAIIDFHSIAFLIEALIFLGGPLYNRRLRRKLALLSDGELSLSPGESKTALLAFRGVRKDLERLTISYRRGDSDEQQFQYAFDSA